MIIGTAGHIDHGKTTLVKALTGVDTDRLKEEKSRGISIDLGFAYKRYPDLTSLAFVDVPGHERFIRNMVAGACGIDFALLVVASNEGPKPQTHEHALVLDLLGIRRGAVVLTKTDLADDDRLAALKGEMAQVLSSHGLSSFPMLAVSAHRRLGCKGWRSISEPKLGKPMWSNARAAFGCRSTDPSTWPGSGRSSPAPSGRERCASAIA